VKIVVVGGSGLIGGKLALYFGAELNERSLVPGDEAALGAILFDEWLGRPSPWISDQNRQNADGPPAQAAQGAGGW
jgi:hypothetical protein